MSDIDIKSAIDNFVAVIEDNVPDPLYAGDNVVNERDSGKFVEINKPHHNAKTPYVLCTCERIDPIFAEAGSTDEDFTYRFEVRIKVAKKQGGYIGGTYYEGMILLHELASDIANQYRANDTTTTGFKIIRKENAGGYIPPTNDDPTHIMVLYYLAEIIKTS